MYVDRGWYEGSVYYRFPGTTKVNILCQSNNVCIISQYTSIHISIHTLKRHCLRRKCVYVYYIITVTPHYHTWAHLVYRFIDPTMWKQIGPIAGGKWSTLQEYTPNVMKCTNMPTSVHDALAMFYPHGFVNNMFALWNVWLDNKVCSADIPLLAMRFILFIFGQTRSVCWLNSGWH